MSRTDAEQIILLFSCFVLFSEHIFACVSGGLLYVVFQELFSSSSPNKVYGKAFNKVKLDPEVRNTLSQKVVHTYLAMYGS